MKVLLDMNIPHKFGALLTQKGVDFLRWSDVGLPSAPDIEIMSYARLHNYVVLTYDLDF
jgi:predicted nuclease of predicted toxin-antitoxin system